MVLKIIFIAICTAVAGVVLKNIKSELSIFVFLSGAVLILLLILSSFSGVFSEIGLIVSHTGVDLDVIKLLFKVVGIGFLCEFASNICCDIGAGNLAEYVLIGGRIAIIVLCFPIIKNLISLISGLV